MFRWLSGVVSVGACCLLSSTSAQAVSLRCGEEIASKGDSTYRVRQVCGEPDDVKQSVVHRTLRHRVPTPCPPGSERRYCEVIVEEVVEIFVENWVYDFGRGRFVEHLRFEQDRLVAAGSGGYSRR